MLRVSTSHSGAPSWSGPTGEISCCVVKFQSLTCTSGSGSTRARQGRIARPRVSEQSIEESRLALLTLAHSVLYSARLQGRLRVRGKGPTHLRLFLARFHHSFVHLIADRRDTHGGTCLRNSPPVRISITCGPRPSTCSPICATASSRPRTFSSSIFPPREA